MAQPREAALQPSQHEPGSLAILHVGGMHDHLEQQPEGIHQNMPLAAIHLLAAVVAMWPTLFGRLDRLAINDRGAGSGLASSRATHALTQDSLDPRPETGSAPEAKIVEDRGPGTIVPWHIPPGAARAQEVEDPVEDAAEVDAPRTSA